MKYHTAINLIQDAIQVLGDTLESPDVQRKYGFEELRGKALEELLSLAAECPEHERSVWASAMLHFADLNDQLAALHVAPLEMPTWTEFMPLLEDWRLRHADEVGLVTEVEDVPEVGAGSDFFASLLDPELVYAERASRVMARIRQQKHAMIATHQPAPLDVVLGEDDKPLVEAAVRLALRLKGFEEHSFQVLLEEIGAKYAWRFDEAAEAAWRQFFCEQVTNAFIADAA